MKRILIPLAVLAAFLAATGCNTSDTLATVASEAAYLATNYQQIVTNYQNFPQDVTEIAGILQAAGYTLPADKRQILTWIAEVAQLALAIRGGASPAGSMTLASVAAVSPAAAVAPAGVLPHPRPADWRPTTRDDADRLVDAGRLKGRSGRTVADILGQYSTGGALLDSNHVTHTGGQPGR
jgi:hypothetical protein